MPAGRPHSRLSSVSLGFPDSGARSRLRAQPRRAVARVFPPVPTMSHPVIAVENVSKHYVVGRRASAGGPFQYTALRDVIAARTRDLSRQMARLARGARPAPETAPYEFWALRDVSFEVRQGEVLGIIGRNGAGKSTLLKILSRITPPTAGRVTLRGRVSTLLDVGTGFHPELTGRENIYLSGAILGMSRAEIRKKFDEMVAFAEVERFIDTPVKRYSSGMYVRLAFAVAAHLEPDIVLLDEVLAVGDADFQRKCLSKMNEVSRQQGRAVLIVTHDMAAVRQFTKRSLLLSSGSIAHIGEPNALVDLYMTEALAGESVEFTPDVRRRGGGTGEARITRLRFDSSSAPVFRFNEAIRLSLDIRAECGVSRIRANMTLFRRDGSPVGCAEGPEIGGLRARETRRMKLVLPPSRLSAGSYYCAISIGAGNSFSGLVDYDIVTETLFFEVVPEMDASGTPGEWNPRWGPIHFEDLSASWDVTSALPGLPDSRHSGALPERAVRAQ
jgi:lipopolysaccharide transport system ATP-binding protein